LLIGPLHKKLTNLFLDPTQERFPSPILTSYKILIFLIFYPVALRIEDILNSANK